MAIVRLSVGVCLALGLTFYACDDDGGKRAIGDTCGTSSQCDSGICGGGTCLDPALDTDGDGLINQVEAALGTDPVVKDTDGDGTEDGAEVGSDTTNPTDSDGDGAIDAVESSTADCDRDQLVDQEDADDGVDAKGVCVSRDGEVVPSTDGGTALHPVQSACLDVCNWAERSGGCEGSQSGTCQTECEAIGMPLPSDCWSLWRSLIDCVMSQPLVCGTADDDNEGVPAVPAACDEDFDAVNTCAGGVPPAGGSGDGSETPGGDFTP